MEYQLLIPHGREIGLELKYSSIHPISLLPLAVAVILAVMVLELVFLLDPIIHILSLVFTGVMDRDLIHKANYFHKESS